MYKFVTDSVTKERKNMNNKVIILDIETTGTDINSDEVLQISIINSNGDTLLNSYVKPKKHTEWKNAEMIHGISPDKVKTSPAISE